MWNEARTFCYCFFSAELNRDHVFHVTFPKEWRSSDLYSLFEPYGQWKGPESLLKFLLVIVMKPNKITTVRAEVPFASCNWVLMLVIFLQILMKWRMGESVSFCALLERRLSGRWIPKLSLGNFISISAAQLLTPAQLVGNDRTWAGIELFSWSKAGPSYWRKYPTPQ